MNELLMNEIKNALKSFNAYINSNFEIILIEDTNRYIDLSNTKTALEFKCKIIEYVSRDCCKTELFDFCSTNKRWQERNLKNLNKYLGTNFTKKEIKVIYIVLGNGIHRKLTEKFVKSNYNIKTFFYGDIEEIEE